MNDNGNPGDHRRDRTAERFAAMGLARDPFPESDLHMDFFSRGGRERLLDALADLWELGRPLVLISGPAGVGRSTFFQALMRRLPDDVRSARITAGVFLSARHLLQAVARAMGLAVDADEGLEEIRDRLYEQIAELGSARTLCAVLVDDADELEADALDELVSFAELSAETPHVRVLLFGGEGLRRVLADAVGSERVDPLAHEVHMEPYTLNELRGYLQFRLARAGLSGASPFSEQDYQDIHVASGGLPRAANAEARRILLARSTRLSLARMGFIAAGVAALLLIGLLIGLLAPTSSEPEPAALSERRIPAAPKVDLGLTAAETSELRGQAGSEAEPELRDGGWLPLAAVGPSGAWEEAAADEAPAALPTSAQRTVASRASTASAEPPQRLATLDTPIEAPVAAPSAPSAPASAPADPEDRHALFDRDPSRYVLQVLVLSARERAETWVREQREPSGYEIYRRTRGGQTQYVIVQGDYPDRRAANAAAGSVASASGQTPFVRDMASVHSELLD